ncbi:hypothetical protein [Burkholderia sp. Nafp2/4-1b]|uniref:hypothetical protein n=1 Tax=Burkholderia sp. Nafp2/4-1b TaxID=2116686 RepID=UPI0013CEC020|nr:hypothetical protein [Burkholderia sp. Nafp2/4-1b]
MFTIRPGTNRQRLDSQTETETMPGEMRAAHDAHEALAAYRVHPRSAAILLKIAAAPALERLGLDSVAQETGCAHMPHDVLGLWTSGHQSCIDAIRELVARTYSENEIFRRLANHRVAQVTGNSQLHPKPILMWANDYGWELADNGSKFVALRHDGWGNLIPPADGSSIERAVIQTLIQDITGLPRDHPAVTQYTNLIMAGPPWYERPIGPPSGAAPAVQYDGSSTLTNPALGYMESGAQFRPAYNFASPTSAFLPSWSGINAGVAHADGAPLSQALDAPEIDAGLEFDGFDSLEALESATVITGTGYDGLPLLGPTQSDPDVNTPGFPYADAPSFPPHWPTVQAQYTTGPFESSQFHVSESPATWTSSDFSASADAPQWSDGTGTVSKLQSGFTSHVFAPLESFAQPADVASGTTLGALPWVEAIPTEAATANVYALPDAIGAWPPPFWPAALPASGATQPLQAYGNEAEPLMAASGENRSSRTAASQPWPHTAIHDQEPSLNWPAQQDHLGVPATGHSLPPVDMMPTSGDATIRQLLEHVAAARQDTTDDLANLRYVTSTVRQQLLSWGYTDHQIRLIDNGHGREKGPESVRRYHSRLRGQDYTCQQIAELAALQYPYGICEAIIWYDRFLTGPRQPAPGSGQQAGLGLSRDDVVAKATASKGPTTFEDWVKSSMRAVHHYVPDSTKARTHIAKVKSFPPAPWSPALDELRRLEYPDDILNKIGARRSHARSFYKLLQVHPEFAALEYTPRQVATMASANTRVSDIYPVLRHHQALIDLGYDQAAITRLASFLPSQTLVSVLTNHPDLFNPPTNDPHGSPENRPGLGLSIDEIVLIAARRAGYQTLNSLAEHSAALRASGLPLRTIVKLAISPNGKERIRIAAGLPSRLSHNEVLRRVERQLALQAQAVAGPAQSTSQQHPEG